MEVFLHMVNQYRNAIATLSIATMAGHTPTFEYWRGMEIEIRSLMVHFFYERQIQPVEADRILRKAEITLASASLPVADLARDLASLPRADSSNVNSNSIIRDSKMGQFTNPLARTNPFEKQSNKKDLAPFGVIPGFRAVNGSDTYVRTTSGDRSVNVGTASADQNRMPWQSGPWRKLDRSGQPSPATGGNHRRSLT